MEQIETVQFNEHTNQRKNYFNVDEWNSELDAL